MLFKALTSTVLGTLTINKFIENEMNNPDIEIYKPVDTVSIIVPVYNEEQFIEKTLKSLRNQTIIQQYPEYFEIILVNNNSTDNSVKIAEPYVDKIINESRKGKLYARNTGILQSTGNLIVAVDADVYYPKHWLNTLLNTFNDPRVSAVGGAIYNTNIPNIPNGIYNMLNVIEKTIIRPNRLSGANSAFYKHQYFQVGKFNESINQMDGTEMVDEEEIGFGNRLSKLGRIVYKLNAVGVHLGGKRAGCRMGRIGISDNQYCTSQGIGIQRFG
jgi:glycosyltransferase involved in cell wall biosynthesis